MPGTGLYKRTSGWSLLEVSSWSSRVKYSNHLVETTIYATAIKIKRQTVRSHYFILGDQNVQKSWAGFPNLLIKLPLNNKKLGKNHNYKAMDFVNSDQALTKDRQNIVNSYLVDTPL